MNKIKVVGKLIKESIFPRKCVFCGKTLGMKSYGDVADFKIRDDLCPICREKAGGMYVKEPACLKCGKEIDDEAQEYCYDCSVHSHLYNRGFAVFKYNNEVKDAVYALKYKGCKIYGEFFGNEMADRYGNEIKRIKPQAVIPVPVHKTRKKKRGYNQAEVIAKQLSDRLGIPMDSEALFRVAPTKPQKELNKVLRRKNVEKAFKVSQNVVEYKKVILVDDIYTTGATIDACAAVMRQAGVKEIYYISICIGAGV